ncbi:MAG: ornithine carbamoyltransferase [Proteobacteria bacterium]|nr:ornithine carbamoyltransferase [Pseudomonadota bacterium]
MTNKTTAIKAVPDKAVRHFLTLTDLTPDEFRTIIHRAIELKSMQHRGEIYEPLKNKVLAMIFEKSSTRTRVSFETGMAQFGGHAIFLSPRDTQLGRGEPIEDSARVLSSMVDCLMVRTFEHEKAELLAQYSSVPVINGLTDDVHPCQLLADMQTYFEQRGDIKGKTVTWVGDGNNMCHSYMRAAKLLDFKLIIACPDGFKPQQNFIDECSDNIEITADVSAACTNSDLIVTDVWASMGQEEEQKIREQAFSSFQVTTELMNLAKDDALFMHCLPAHRGEEVSAEVIDGSQSVVWDEAENRLHAQKALLEFLLIN